MLLRKQNPNRRARVRERERERDLPLPFIVNSTACLNKRSAKTIPGGGALCSNVLSIFHHNVLVDRLFTDVGATDSRTQLSWWVVYSYWRVSFGVRYWVTPEILTHLVTETLCELLWYYHHFHTRWTMFEVFTVRALKPATLRESGTCGSYYRHRLVC